MKLKVIAKDASGNKMHLNLRKECKMILHGKEFEVSSERAKELLALKNEGGAVVEKVKETKENKKANKTDVEIEKIPTEEITEEDE